MWNNVANIPSFVPKAASVPADSRNRQTSVPAGSRNRPASVPTGSRNRPTSVPAGRPFSAGWKNNAARPMTRPTSHYFQHFRRPGYYNHLNMDEGRWGTAVKPSAGCSWRIQRPNMQWGSKNNGGSHQSTCFENVYYVEELQNFNLFSVSQICDTKNKVLFTDKECLVLSKEFQLPESSQVVLRIPRRHNLYCFSLSDIQPKEISPVLSGKSNHRKISKWHRRMAHESNTRLLTRPSHCDEAHISASSPVTHMDRLGPTSIRSIDHKVLPLCVTDDFSRFTWVFFLGTKDETYGILKNFITFIENQLTKKVKAIRCDNGTEFKIFQLIELCGSKGIRRDYSNARTPQQNGVAERKNRTLIEAARTMLADSKLPTMFWTEAVSTACYVLNRRHVGKIGGKAEEGFIIGYAAHKFIPRFKANKLQVPKILTYLQVHKSAASRSECDEQVIDYYAEELARLQKQAYEANITAEKHLSQADLATSRNRVPAGKVDSAAGVTDGPTDPSKPVKPPTRLWHFLLLSYDDAVWSIVTNLAPSIVVDSVPTKRVNTIHPQSQILGDLYFTCSDKRQERGIDYDEVFFSINARIEAIRLFLAFASYMGFMVYQMDVKSAFLYGGIEEEVYVTQPKHQGLVYVDDIIFGSTNKAWCDDFEVLMKGEFEMSAMGELTFFLGLQVKQKPDGIFISQDKYVQDILKKFDMESVRPATTPFEASKPKSKDEPMMLFKCSLIHTMIGSLMYLTASRPDIQFAVSACSRHQVTPLTSNLNAVKKIFKYLKGQPKLGLWYPRDSPFVLEAYSLIIDYAGSQKTIVATSSTESRKYVAAATVAVSTLDQNQMLDNGSNEKKSYFMSRDHTDENVADLLTKAFDGPSVLSGVARVTYWSFTVPYSRTIPTGLV
ncbi:putative ribonuclease H-like domain-containing protein [Tanacetum coccineum]|uniref:Ribonuclease H-like domain-containing protein n=1 Tax=Tanacetum coccineum TaxID=301880 RepID=A0ABQ5HPP3_9ASTR